MRGKLPEQKIRTKDQTYLRGYPRLKGSLLMIEKSVPKGRTAGHIFFACLFIAALVFPLVVRLPFLQHLMIMIFLYAAIAGGWNIIAGYCGQVSLG